MSEIKETLVKPKTRIGVVYAGGTISSLATPQGYREGGHVVDLVGKLEEKNPDFRKSFELGGTEVAYTGLSENMDEEYLARIGSATRKALERNKGVVITHGTDSMEQTARYLQSELGDLLTTNGAKVVITGANEDLTHPQTDAWNNLTFAFESTKEPVGNGVFVGFHKKLIPAKLVVKEPFNGREMNYVSKDSDEYRDAVDKQTQQNNRLIAEIRGKMNGSDAGRIVEYAVNLVRPDHHAFLNEVALQPVRAVLLNLYHSGTANTEKHGLSVAELVKRLREEQGIVFFGATENGEPVDFHSYETSVKLREAGVVPLYNMDRNVALVKLSLLPSKTMSNTQLIDAMLTSVAGEIDEARVFSEDIDSLKELYK